MKLCVTAEFPRKYFVAPKIGKMDQKWAKTGFLNLLNLFCNDIYLICCVPAQIPYLGKFLFLRYDSKDMGQNILTNQIAGFFNQQYL